MWISGRRAFLAEKSRYGLLGKDRNFGLCSKCNWGASGRYCAGW